MAKLALVVVHAALATPFGLVVDAIRWIGHKQMRLHAIQDLPNIVGGGAVAAEQAMRSEQPEISGSADRLVGQGRDVVGVGKSMRAERQQSGDLVLGEPGQRQIKAGSLQLPQLKCQKVGVPAGVQRQLVVTMM